MKYFSDYIKIKNKKFHLIFNLVHKSTPPLIDRSTNMCSVIYVSGIISNVTWTISWPPADPDHLGQMSYIMLAIFNKLAQVHKTEFFDLRICMNDMKETTNYRALIFEATLFSQRRWEEDNQCAVFWWIFCTQWLDSINDRKLVLVLNFFHNKIKK